MLIYQEPNWRIKRKLSNIFEIYSKTNKITYSFYNFFYIDLRFAIMVRIGFKILE